MPLDPQFQAVRDARAAEGTPPLYTLTLEQARAADLADIRAGAGGGQRVHEVTEEHVPGPGGTLTVRVHRPDATPGRPVLLYFYGGGWTLGSLDTCDAVCRFLANAAGCVTVSAGYRLAPEHPFPAAVEDCWAALCWTAANAQRFGGDPTRIAVAGDSAGGNLAAVTAQTARDRGGPALAHQVLVYPNTDYRPPPERPHAAAAADPYLFNERSVDWYWSHYLARREDGADPRASPLRARDLTGLAPATVVTAEYDPLCAEGQAYAARLREAGVPVELRRWDGMAHGFFTMTGVLPQAREAQEFVAARLRAALAGPAVARSAHSRTSADSRTEARP
ncbi:alpha/beta hydrolase [Actinacidiphila acididurans]|uniref:Alpha/beta hydrolase n=1 Tax=Actinacidiphila acididurans TaxID=2784346 RepID=A0ABS2U3T0_9ACTN|nr:alpha/beta hydrolase [Actinacidiphila acididurans]MBM9509836.1 alpha/beta hydrolase [Actinacidiphila acididurans]